MLSRIAAMLNSSTNTHEGGHFSVPVRGEDYEAFTFCRSTKTIRIGALET